MILVLCSHIVRQSVAVDVGKHTLIDVDLPVVAELGVYDKLDGEAADGESETDGNIQIPAIGV